MSEWETAVLVFLVTLVLVVLPFFPAFCEVICGKDKQPTPINTYQLQDLRDNPERIWDLISLSKLSHFLEVQEEQLKVEHTETLYCVDSLRLNKTERLFELHVFNDIDINAPLAVAWWLMAQNIFVKQTLIAVGKIQAREKQLIGAPVEFHQLQASLIQVGQDSDFTDDKGISAQNGQLTRNIYKGDWRIGPHKKVSGHWVIHGNATLEGGAHLDGSLKVWGELFLEKDSSVSGAVFVTENAICDKGSRVEGVFVVEKKLQTFGGNTFGSSQNPISVVAEEIFSIGSIRVFGNIKAWKKGLLTATDTVL